MIVIEGFSAAKLALSRQASAEFYPVSPALRQRIKEIFGSDDPEKVVRQIAGEVRDRGDAALRDYTLKIDGVELDSLEVDKQQLATAYREVDKELVSALKLAAERIYSFHVAQKENMLREFSSRGSSQLIRPLPRVGVYVPGGTACYPSTVLMTAIPAMVVGVGEVVLVTPPRSAGVVPPLILAAADMAGVDRVFSVGGAQAIAALAFGTDSVPKVDKICGPGNVFVVLAKKLVYGAVDIDGLQGPSEVLIIADGTAKPGFCAAELLAQAEHDPLASAVLITNSRRLADEIGREVKRQLEGLPRKDIAAECLANRGVLAVVGSMDEAIELGNLYAPEHLCLMMDRADTYIDRISHAGCIFTGEYPTVALGDYVAGPSHALPTGGTARFGSPLNVCDFIKFISLVNVERADLKPLGKAAATIARAEGFEAHARAVEKRMEAEEGGGNV